MKINVLIENIEKDFPNARILENTREIEDIVGFYLELTWGQLKMADLSVDDHVIKSIWKAVKRFSAGEPKAYILGEQFFYKNIFTG